MMSAVTSRQRVAESPTCKLPRLAIETDPVRNTFGAFHDAEMSRAPCADNESAFLTSPHLPLHTSPHHLSPNAYILETRIT